MFKGGRLPLPSKEYPHRPAGGSPPQASRSSIGRFLVVSGSAGVLARLALLLGLAVLLGVSYSIVQTQKARPLLLWRQAAGQASPKEGVSEVAPEGTQQQTHLPEDTQQQPGEIPKEQLQPGEPDSKEPKPKEPKPQEPKPEEPKPEEPKPQEPKPEDPKPEEPKPDEPKPEEPKPDEPKPEEPKPEEPKPEELKPEEPKPEEPKPEEPKLDTGPADPNRPSKCSDDCFKHGTCNEERGECFCLPPWGGKDCNEHAMPACQLSDKFWTPCKDITTCECMQECQKYALTMGRDCLRGTNEEGSKVTDLNALFAGPRYPVRFNEDFTEMLLPDYNLPADTSVCPQMNPEECPGTCGGHSGCGREHHNCYCSWATAGAECEQTPSGLRVPCFNGCSGRGECLLGTCKCDRGYFGMDCSLYLDTEGKTRILERPPYNWTKAARWPQDSSGIRPKIYVYDLPTYFNTWQGLYSNFLDWAEPIWLVERMHNTPHRTTNAEEADFFFIPLFIRNRDGNRAGVVRLALSYIKEKYPSNWARNNGADHFVFTNSDWGNCELGGTWGYMYGHMQPVLDDIFTLTLWGCTKSMDLDDDRPCFRPGRDIVIPPDQDITVFKFAVGIAPEPPQPPFDKRTILLYFRGYPALDKGPWGKGGYTWSFNVRQEMFNLYYRPKPQDPLQEQIQAGREIKADPNGTLPTGIVLETMEKGPWDYWHLRQMLRSIFCLGPAGWGWGMRAPQVVLLGCIPVVIQPYTKQPFEDDGLDWNEFGVVLTKEDIPSIEKILSDIPSEVIEQKRQAMERIKNRFIWSSTNYNPLMFLPQEEQDRRAQQLLESDAFEGIMEALRGKLRKAGKL